MRRLAKFRPDRVFLRQVKLFFVPRHARSRAGATAVEFALLAPVFLILAVGVIELGRAFWISSSLQYAVEQTTRVAMAQYTRESWTRDSDDFDTWFATWYTGLDTEAQSQILGFDPDWVTFEAPVQTVEGDVQFLSLTATHQFEPLLAFIPLGDMTLSATSKVPLHDFGG
ncbi:MAG: TadE/TadG family type IV pilus assembly protein [Magnetospiraceae bacterium]